MQHLLDRYLFAFPRNAAEGAGGAGAEAGVGDGAGSPPAAGNGAPLDGSGGAPPSGQPAAPYFPDGLQDNLRGQSDQETIDLMATALKGYRERDSTVDRPDNADGYLNFEGLDDKLVRLDDKFKPYFDSFANDPGIKAAAEVALKHGISRPAFLEGLQAALSGLSEAGVLEPMVDFEAERQALLPDAARSLSPDQQNAAIDRRMNDNLAFVELMVSNRNLPKEAGEYASLMLADSAKGHLFLEWMRNTIQGGGGAGPGAHGQGGGGSITHAQLKERQSDPRNNPNDMKFDKAFAAETTRLYKAFEEAGGNFE